MQDNQKVSRQRQQIRDRIVMTAMHAFARNGVKAVRMDDIAQQLGMSKRKLYEMFDNKEDLLVEGIRRYRQERECEALRHESECGNVIECVLLVYREKVEEFRLTVPQFYCDILKYPRVVALLESDRQKNHRRLVSFLQRGVQEGRFRNDIDFEIVSKFFETIGQYAMQQQLYRIYSIEQLFHNLVFVTLRGICTQQGIDELDRFLSGYVE